jgi:hypothetical protein
MLPYSTVISDRDLWFFRSVTHFNQIFVNGLSGNGIIWLNGIDISTLFNQSSSDIITINSFLQSNSSIWITNYSTTNTLSASWSSAYNTTNSLSGDWNSTYTTVNANSAIWTIGGIPPPLSAVTSAGATTTDTLYLSNVNIETLNTSVINATGINIDTHAGATRGRKVILMDEDGNSFEVYLRSGILTID